MKTILIATLLAVCCAEASSAAAPASALQQLEQELVAQHGEAQRERVHRGITQVAARWRAEDGDAAAMAQFIRGNYLASDAQRNALFARFSHNLEMIFGHAQEVSRELNAPSDLDTGPLAPYESSFAAWSPTAHLLDDWFTNKLAFVALLNFPLRSLAERNELGPKWSRQDWAEAALAETFRQRIPAAAAQAAADAYTENQRYIAGYNIWMHHVLTPKGERLFPADKRLLSHWNLRDEIKADYADVKQGLAKQRMIQRVMERIVAQEIPAMVIDNPKVDWYVYSNEVRSGKTLLDAPREADQRYAQLLASFHAQQQIDRYSPDAPRFIDRVFDQQRQLSEARVEAMLEQIVSSPLVARTGKLVAKRLGRKLEPFDIWYNGFRAKSRYSEAELDALIAKKYPTAAAFQADIPQILRKLGFAADRADYLAKHIVVEPARGSGHAMGAALRGSAAHLRTRVEAGGMNYKGYNIAVHELGHNVEQTFSLNDIDQYLLHGVPNTAFTEALAFTFQDRDLELLGLQEADPQSQALAALDTFWGAYEIGGVALVDMRVWRWMYAHPDATPAALREATVAIAKEVWNQFYAPVFGQRDVTLLAIYSHMISEKLYLPDYPLGHMIAFQVQAQMSKAASFGAEFERVARLGAIAPDYWMQQATGAPVGPEALLRETELALQVVK